LSRVPPTDAQRFEALLREVERPARYVGGEVNSVIKTAGVTARLALCFPDLYEIAESYLGFKILYDVVNRVPRFAAERVHAVAPDLEQVMRRDGVRLGSLETRRPLRDFDVVGFTLQYELGYPTLLAMLDLGGVSLHARARADGEPIVLGGGAGAANPEILAPFFDAFLLGDGEEAIVEILDAVAQARARGATRAEQLQALAAIPGVYVPSLFEVEYDGLAVRSVRAPPDASASGPSRHGTPRVARRVLADLDAIPYPIHQLEPTLRPVHDRFAIEVQRGCSQGCRFCQAGMIQRPTRQRRAERILDIATQAVAESGADTIGLLSLSAGDYGALDPLLAALLSTCEPRRVALSLPSLRTETLTPAVAERVSAVSSTSFTLAPEAGSERLRRVINKTNREEDLLAGVRAAVGAGARSVKLYFMIGLPTETEADLDELVALAVRARTAAREVRRDAQVTVAISTFIPKPHTPFQWERQGGLEETRDKQRRLKEQLRARRIQARYHDPEQSFLEGVLARGDRRLAPALEAAMRAGCRLDAWTEHFDAPRWRAALTSTLAPQGLAPEDFLGARDPDRLLPWDHLDMGLLKKFLRRERDRAYAEGAVEDCALGDRCYACGGCDLGNPYLTRAERNDPTRPPLQPRIEPSTLAPETIAAAALPPPPEADATCAPEHRTRLRLRYEKVGRAAHLSQLESMEPLLRALRQSGLPMLYSQGYTKRPRVSFSPACPTGIDSVAEYLDVLCVRPVDAAAAKDALNQRLPEGLRVLDSEVTLPDAPSINDDVCAVTYDVVADARAHAAADRFLAMPRCVVSVPRKAARRRYDARVAVLSLVPTPTGLEVTLGFGNQGALKIGEALGAILGPELAATAQVTKVRVSFGAGLPPPLATNDDAAALELSSQPTSAADDAVQAVSAE